MLIPGFPVPVFGGGDASLIVGQDETNYNGSGGNGTFSSGTSSQYDVGNSFTLSNGAEILIDATSAGGVKSITGFTVTVTGPAESGETYTGSGIYSSFSITPGANNIE